MANTTGISFSGLASGLDTAGIIEKLMSLERRPQSMLIDKVSMYTARKNIYSTLSAKLSALDSAKDEILSSSSNVFGQKKVSTTDAKVVEAAISGTNPTTGSFVINTTQMAAAAMVGSSAALYTGADREAQAASFVSSSAINAPSQSVDPSHTLAADRTNFNTQPATSGTLVINGIDIAWDDSMSLNDIMGQINNSDADVTAAFNSGTQEFSLVSNLTGSTVQLTISESAGNLLGALNLTAGTDTGADAVETDITKAVGSADAHLDTTVTSGTFTINGVVFSVNANTDSMQSVLARINKSTAGVTASYDETSGKIALTQKATGSSKTIVLGASGDTSNFLNAMKLSGNNPPVGGAGDTYTGKDALVSINGGAVQTLDSNILKGVVPGATLTLHSTGTATVTIDPDVDGMVQTIKDFVSEYNSVMTYINSKLGEERIEDPETVSEKLSGAFISDALFIDTKYDLLQIFTSAVSGLPTTMNQMAQIGIEPTGANFGKSATLEVDEETLRAALTDSPEGVAALFNDPDNGILTQMSEKLETLTDYTYGSLTAQQKEITDNMTAITKQIESMETRMVKREERLKMQFTNMEIAIARMNSMGSALTSMLG